MLPFFKKKTSAAKIQDLNQLQKSFMEAVAAGDHYRQNDIIELLQQYPARSPEDQKTLEEVAGRCLTAMARTSPGPIQPRLEWHYSRFPRSLTPVRVDLARCKLLSHEHDEATWLARDYLHDVARRRLLDRLEGNPLVRYGVSRAFPILTESYQRVGALSYNLRIIDLAFRFALNQQGREELGNLEYKFQEELREASTRQLDDGWERFFRAGQAPHKLIQWCRRQHCPHLARRIELLDRQMRAQRDWRPDDKEILCQVRHLPERNLYLLISPDENDPTL